MRPIDGEEYMKLLKEQYLHHKAMGNNQISKAWQGAMQLLYDMPTLTPQNETPPCYQPDGDGCAYQCYDGDDEPIDKCKECPLCYSDKQRHITPQNEWIDPAVELPPDDDMVLAIVSGKPADNITLEDAYELASYGSEDGWIVEQYELWETPTVTWWRPLPDPPERKKED